MWKHDYNNNFYFFLHLSYSAQPKVTMHYSAKAKLFGFSSTNKAMVVKIAI